MKKISIKNQNIANQLLYTSILVMVSLGIILIAYISISSLVNTNNISELRAKANAKSVIEKIDRNFYERFGDVQAFAYNRLAVRTAVSDTTKQDAQDFINTMVSYYVLYDLMMITDIQGNVVAVNTIDKTGKTINTSSLLGKNFSNEEWFRSCVSGTGPEGGAYYSDFMINSISSYINGNNGWGMTFSAPIKDNNGTTVGVWYNFANWTEVTQGIRNETQLALAKNLPGSFLLVTNTVNEVIDADDPILVTSKNMVSENEFLINQAFTLNGKKISKDDYVIGKVTGKGAYIYKGKDWNVLTFVPRAKFTFAYFVDELLILFLSVIALTVFICFIFYRLAKRISSNINILKEDLLILSTGNLVEVKQIETQDEIGEMSSALRNLVHGLQKKSDFASKIGAGELQADYTSESHEDSLGFSLLNMRDNLAQVAEEDKKRNWITEGLAKFGDILRGNNDGLEILADNIISGLVKYLGANQGALFIVNDSVQSDVYLEMIACYAWNKKKYLHLRVDEGEGLVGQAWQENDTLYITEVPQDFVKITSGLGEATPNCFLIVPLTVNDETFGVIEIASFEKMEQYHIDFVNKLAESIASTLSTTKTNERTKVLLEISQQQTEEMLSQEEEMRQNMEEMQATQEEMERKELQMKEMVEKMQAREEDLQQQIDLLQASR